MILSKTTIKGALTTSVVTAAVVFGPVLWQLPKSDLKRLPGWNPLSL